MLLVEARTSLDAFELDVAFTVGPGACLALAGPSGAGKTTVLRIVAGLERPDAGRVTCGERAWLDTDRGVTVAAEHRRCGYVFQHYALFEHLSVWQNVAYGIDGASRSERRRRASDLLARFGIDRLADARPRTLSGGERQRVAVARALARRPEVLLLDEPLSALDARTRARAARELATILRGAGVPALLVTHDFHEAAVLGDDVAVIDRGRVVQRGNPAELAARPATAFVADFTGAVVLTGSAQPGPDGLTRVTLDGGGVISTTAAGAGPVAVSVFPWEIALEPLESVPVGSAQNRLDAEVLSVTPVGNRVRVGLVAAQPLTAEVTEAAARGLRLRSGTRVVASWKATATRVVSL
ncbi:MAG TPA: ABC transporter ATP-binding protein [Solirubrobacteraceae bacterium]|nr:ABC transporter ATP-binding protein [Solirubrobacteraceae bacterium]